MEKNFLNIEVVYANKKQQWIIPVTLPMPATIEQAINASRILDRCPAINLSQQKVGIFGVIKNLETLLQPNDRVEIYQPIMIDPMQQRRLRVKAQKKRK